MYFNHLHLWQSIQKYIDDPAWKYIHSFFMSQLTKCKDFLNSNYFESIIANHLKYVH